MTQPLKVPPLSDTELWLEGQTWQERLSYAHSAPPTNRDTLPEDKAWLDAWQHAVDPEKAGLFARRLAFDDINEQQACLARTGRLDCDASPPWWPIYSKVCETLRSVSESKADHVTWLNTLTGPDPATDENVPFIHLWWPVARQFWPGDNASIRQIWQKNAIHDAQAWIASQLAYLSARALMELFAGKRPPSLSLQLALAPEPVAKNQDAYATFIMRLASEGLEPLSAAFPVLPRLIATKIISATRMLNELHDRLHTDALAIDKIFGIDLPLHILRILPGAGDTHCGGRSVTILTLAHNHSTQKIVYKPKSMQLEQEYHRLAANWIGTPPRPYPLRTLAVNHTHGYVNFLEHCPATGQAELSAFYRNAGRLLALLHLLGASDCHAENMIAHASALVLIDPETLFDAPLREQPDDPLHSSLQTRKRDLASSVLRVGMLPAWQYDAAQKRAFDISALGYNPSTFQNQTPYTWRNINTDAMAFGLRSDTPIPSPSPCLPVSAQEPNPLPHFVNELCEGYLSAGQELLAPENRQERIRRLHTFTGLQRRLVLRATRIYGIIQQRLLASDCLRSASRRGLELEKLSRSLLLDQTKSPLWQCYQAEVYDMEHLDIPFFYHTLGSLDLHGSGMIVPDVLTRDGLAEAIERVQHMHTDDLQWQAQIIRAAIGVRGYQMQNINTVPATHHLHSKNGLQDDEKNAFLTSILAQIENSAITDDHDHATWLGFGLLTNGSQVGLGFMDPGFYSGRAGLVAFLGKLADARLEKTISDRANTLFKQTWQPLRDSLLKSSNHDLFRMLRDCGLGLNGLGGFLRLLAQPSKSIPREDTVKIRHRLLAVLSNQLVKHDRCLDMIGGAAGAIGPIADLHREKDTTPYTTQALRLLADHLVKHQDHATGGWLTIHATRPLTGMSHGAAGIGLALLRAGSTLNDEHYLQAGVRAFDYESRLFDPKAGNWPDLRTAAPSFMNTWCHGATGICLARGCALQILPEHPAAEQWHKEIEAAKQTITDTSQKLPTDHLCCGNAGQACTLKALGCWFNDKTFLDAEKSITAAIIEQWRQTGKFLFNDVGTNTTIGISSFMTGLPGIGMHLLASDQDTSLAEMLT